MMAAYRPKRLTKGNPWPFVLAGAAIVLAIVLAVTVSALTLKGLKKGCFLRGD